MESGALRRMAAKAVSLSLINMVSRQTHPNLVFRLNSHQQPFYCDVVAVVRLPPGRSASTADAEWSISGPLRGVVPTLYFCAGSAVSVQSGDRITCALECGAHRRSDYLIVLDRCVRVPKVRESPFTVVE